ncbi:MAG: hypothetical protein ABI406_04120 [Ktedonobacteraceae bacterium]
MRLHILDILNILKQRKTSSSLALYVKCGAIFTLFALSILVVACGGSGTNTNIDNPAVTVTINLGDNGSPTPPVPAYSCNAWITNTTPSVYANAIAVYAKYTHQNTDGNPEGINGATATADVLWPDGNNTIVTVPTTSDGLAVFPVSIANRSADLNKIVLVTVQFSGGGAPNCTVGTNQAAFFTLVIATPTVSPTATNPAGGGGPGPKPSRTPKATKTPKGG